MADKEIKQHQLFISNLKLWRTLKRENKIAPQHKKMFRKILWMTLATAPFRCIQSLFFNRKIRKVSLQEKQPVFVLGHWRSGTTHLHYLLAKDEQFSYLENFQAFFFRVSMISKTFMKPILNAFMPATRPQDNIKITANSPSEEEHPLTNLTEKSGMQTFFFPQNRSYYDKYNLFKGTTAKEKEEWKDIYHWMLQNISFYTDVNKRLLLKNPHNMGRIEVLLELYPDAKFVHIHRNPYDIYKSNVHLYNKTIHTQFLQDFTPDEIEERVLYCFETTMQKYLLDYSKIPKGNLVEISYAELSNAGLATIEKVYEELNLGDFDKVKPQLEEYLSQEKNYKKNSFTEIRPEILEQINSRWDFAFKHWGYDKV
ncbi:MAG: hypothetical protein ACI8Q1_003673 [Parvicella sp.]|jgi:hypothetical protein